MSPRSTLTLANGTGIDLRFPRPSDYGDFDWVAEHLAKIKRYNGATRDVEYSVAQHACHCCDTALEIYGDPLIAAYALIHDDHEAALGDDTTPKKRAIAEEAADKLGVLATDVLKVFDAITERHDVALHAQAGLPWPMTQAMAEKVKTIDLMLFVREWHTLMPGVAHPDWTPYQDIPLLNLVIVPWDWPEAKMQFMSRCRRYLPALKKVECVA